MTQHQKAANLMRKKDRLTDLPDGILSSIVSMLPLKEAVKTSILSRSWRFIWTSQPDLLFDSVNILGSTIYSSNISSHVSELSRQVQRDMYIERVNHLMRQRYKGPKIDSLAIHFHLGPDYASIITQWISCAVTKGVEKIDLDLSECCSFKENQAPSTAPSEQYTFPCWVLAAPGKASRVKHLQLTSCSLSSLPIGNSLASMVSVELQGVNITDQQLESFLSICFFLERMILHCCNDLVNLKFTGPSSRLKLLTIKNCFRMENIEIYAENLVMLEYTGQLPRFSFKNVPKLAEMLLCFTGTSRLDGLTYVLSRLAYDLPQLENLNLISILAITALNLPEKVPAFTNIKQLVLTVCPFLDEDKLCWISYILKAFPLLNKLQLNLFSPGFIKQSKEIDRQLPEWSHKHLNELEINGYYGNRHEVELLKYLVYSAVGLELVVINPCQKVYKGVNNWDYEEASSCYKLSTERIERLHAVVPPTVHLKIQ